MGLSLERLRKPGESGTPRFPNSSRRGSTIEVRRADLSDLGDGGGDRRDPGTIHQEGVRYGPALKSDGGKTRGPDGGIQGQKQWAARRESGRRRKADMECHSCHQNVISRENARPTLGKDARETDSRRRPVDAGGCSDRGVDHGGKWTIPPWTDRGERGQLPGRYGIRGVWDMEEIGSCGGRANQDERSSAWAEHDLP